MPDPNDMQEFFDRLDACNDTDPRLRTELESDLWLRFGAVKTVLILDMAGFTAKVQNTGYSFSSAKSATCNAS